jgi:ribosomal protein S12 methylthiotransferase
VSEIIELATRGDKPAGGAPRVALIALGCAKNLVDAEQMLGSLEARGYRLVTRADEAEVVIVNTCSFLQAARDEAIAEIRGAARLKRLGACDTLVVSGCLAQLDPDLVRAKCPEVDIVIGVSEFPRLGEVLDAARADRALRPVEVSLPQMPYQDYLPRRRATPPWTAYVKIAEGCDCACSFCLIPTIRGSFRSRSIESVTAEAQQLAREGVREINLIAEDLTHFGRDWGGRRALADLLRALGEVDGLAWIRLLYCYPTKVDDALIAAIAEVPKVVKYLDMPLQHAHNDILRAMNRGGRREGYLRLLGELRAAVPDICVRSTFIVGFPGERREEFAALESFLDEARLDRVGFFPFSAEKGTPAATLSGQVAPGVARSRVARLALRQADISRQRNAALVGRTMEVLTEESGPNGSTGRSYRDAPEIDGVVRFSGQAVPGEMARVRIDSADEHDLAGSLAGDEVSR